MGVDNYDDFLRRMVQQAATAQEVERAQRAQENRESLRSFVRYCVRGAVGTPRMYQFRCSEAGRDATREPRLHALADVVWDGRLVLTDPVSVRATDEIERLYGGQQKCPCGGVLTFTESVPVGDAVPAEPPPAPQPVEPANPTLATRLSLVEQALLAAEQRVAYVEKKLEASAVVPAIKPARVSVEGKWLVRGGDGSWEYLPVEQVMARVDSGALAGGAVALSLTDGWVSLVRGALTQGAVWYRVSSLKRKGNRRAAYEALTPDARMIFALGLSGAARLREAYGELCQQFDFEFAPSLDLLFKRSGTAGDIELTDDGVWHIRDTGYWRVASEEEVTRAIISRAMDVADNGDEGTREARTMAKVPVLEEEGGVVRRAAKALQTDATDAAWRTAGSQFVKLAREPLVGLLSRHLAPGDDSARARIAAFLETEIGSAMLAGVLSMGLSAVPASVGPVAPRLARELRVKGMAGTADVVADVLMGPMREVAKLYLQGVPAEDPYDDEQGRRSDAPAATTGVRAEPGDGAGPGALGDGGERANDAVQAVRYDRAIPVPAGKATPPGGGGSGRGGSR